MIANISRIWHHNGIQVETSNSWRSLAIVALKRQWYIKVNEIYQYNSMCYVQTNNLINNTMLTDVSYNDSAGRQCVSRLTVYGTSRPRQQDISAISTPRAINSRRYVIHHVFLWSEKWRQTKEKRHLESSYQTIVLSSPILKTSCCSPLCTNKLTGHWTESEEGEMWLVKIRLLTPE